MISQLLLKWKALQDSMAHNFLGGPKICKIAWIINFEKYAAVISFALMMMYYENYSYECWIYLGLHAGYSLGWLLKHYAYPDKSWETRVTAGGALFIWFAAVGWYLVMGWVLASGYSTISYPLQSEAWLGFAVALCLVGTALMLVADAQKYFCLKNGPHLITYGFFKHIRHPNYLGEMLIYLSFALIVWHWIAFLILGYIWLGLFLPNLIAIEKSISRYPGWIEYRKRSWAIIPFLW